MRRAGLRPVPSEAPSPHRHPPARRGKVAVRRATLIAATLTAFSTPFMGSAVNVALPTIGRDLKMDALALGWVATAFILAAAASLVPLGRIADIYGRKRIFTWGVLLFTASSCLCALAPSAPFLILARVVQGVGGAMIFGTGTAILVSVFPLHERGRVLGFNVAAVYIGLSAGPFLGGLLTEHLGWRSLFLTMLPLGLVIVYIAAKKITVEWTDARGEPFDAPGAVLYAAGLAALMYGFASLPEARGVGFICGGLAGLALFVRREARTAYPILNLLIFRDNPAFIFSNVAALINYSATFSVSFLLSLYLQYIQGLEPMRAGLVLVAMPVMQALFSPLAGRLSDRIAPRILASAGMAATVVSLVLFTRLDAASTLPYILTGLIVLGVGFAFFSSPNTNAVMSAVNRKLYGVASGVLAAMRLTGQMMSMGIAMVVFSVLMGGAHVTPECHPQFLRALEVIFWVMALLCTAGVFASLARGGSPRRPGARSGADRAARFPVPRAGSAASAQREPTATVAASARTRDL